MDKTYCGPTRDINIYKLCTFLCNKVSATIYLSILLPAKIDFHRCREKIAASLNEYCNRWCKREHLECDALKDWKLNIFKIIDRRVSFYLKIRNCYRVDLN